MRKLTWRVSSVGVLLVGALLGACNDHPVERLENTVSAVNRQENHLPAKTKIDFLFVMDNSGSMCEEQRNLTSNFRVFSDFLFDQLGAAADYRIAVVSTDMHAPNGEMGRFLRKPAAYQPSLNCLDDQGEPLAPDTADCHDGDLPLIIKSGKDGNIADKADLERKFRCLATLGTGGIGFEKGLESMRVALSCAEPACVNRCLGDANKCANVPAAEREVCCQAECRGPNASAFGKCCQNGVYNPACTIEQGETDPEFLRPDALLVVIFITDENDCSDPISNINQSRRAICKYGPADTDSDGIPDGYRDANLCGTRTPEECYRAECGVPQQSMTPEQWARDCYSQRCEIPMENNSFCEWRRNDLTPVEDYYRFLTSLKAQPGTQLLVASIAGQRAFTESDYEITYNEGPLPEICDEDSASYDPDVSLDTCCPQGRCMGSPQPSCSSTNGQAFAGRRYLQLSELFEDNGIGCKGPDDSACVTICDDNFAASLEAIRDRVIRLTSTYCLDKVPACQVPAHREESGEVVAARLCETAEELADKANYLISVKMECSRTAESTPPGNCEELIPPQTLPSSQWSLELNQPTCGGGALVRLNPPPPAGADVYVEFLVQVGGQTVNPDASTASDATVGPDALPFDAAPYDGALFDAFVFDSGL